MGKRYLSLRGKLIVHCEVDKTVAILFYDIDEVNTSFFSSGECDKVKGFLIEDFSESEIRSLLTENNVEHIFSK